MLPKHFGKRTCIQKQVSWVLTFLIHLLVTRCPNPSTILPQICCAWYPNNHSCCCCCQNQTKKAAGRQVAHFSDIWKLPVSIWEISPWCPGLRCKQMSLRTVVPMQWKSCAEMSKKEHGVERKMVFWCLILVAFFILLVRDGFLWIYGFSSVRILKASVPRSHTRTYNGQNVLDWRHTCSPQCFIAWFLRCQSSKLLDTKVESEVITRCTAPAWAWACWKSAETGVRWWCVRVWRFCQTWHALPRPVPPLAKLGTPPPPHSPFHRGFPQFSRGEAAAKGA